MKILDTKIPEVKIIEPDVFGDHRGWFMETWSEPKYAQFGFKPVQDNESFTAQKGTLRGIHFQQSPMAQAKIVRVTRGAVMDVAVDLRKGDVSAVGVRGAERGEQAPVLHPPRFRPRLCGADGRRELLLQGR